MNIATVVLKNFGNKICDKSLNKNFEKKKIQSYSKTKKLEVNIMNKRLKLKNIIAENIGNKQVNIRKGIKFGNKFWKRKL